MKSINGRSFKEKEEQSSLKLFVRLGIIFCIITSGLYSAKASDGSLHIQGIRIRDPFIYLDRETKTYLMYAQSGNREGSDFQGVEVYTSKDLINWTYPVPVLILPDSIGIKSVWAPEMHPYGGKYYLFVTLTYNKLLPLDKPVSGKPWPDMHKRGTHIFHAANPYGPFEKLNETSFTPEYHMALDGTLYIENRKPYLVYCHEWVELIDGTIAFMPLEDDIADVSGKSQVLFKASDAPGAITNPDQGKVTDGCFLYRSPASGKLFMIWSTFLPGDGYCILLTWSDSGKINGPWQGHIPIYRQNGGHGMIFKTYEGIQLLAIHQPNTSGLERLHLFEIIDSGDMLQLGKEIDLYKSH